MLRFAEPTDPHPLGRLLVFDGGKFASSYRIRDRQIMVVNRHPGKENMTITMLENDTNADGRFLPRTYVVEYWDAATGQLARTETVQNTWVRLGQWDLPVRQSVTTASAAGLAVRQFTLSKHALAKSLSGRSQSGA